MILRFIIRRALSGLLTMFAISAVMFVLFYVAPNDPAHELAGPQATSDVVEQIQRRLRARPSRSSTASAGSSVICCMAISATRTTASGRCSRQSSIVCR